MGVCIFAYKCAFSLFAYVCVCIGGLQGLKIQSGLTEGKGIEPLTVQGR